jgi:O-antigen/teichoic acid export membrane protein
VILAIGQLVNVGTGTAANLLVMAGRARLTLVTSIVFLAVSLALDLLLIPRHGLLGAAVANASAMLMVNLLRLWLVHRVLGLEPYDRRFLRPLAAGLAAGAAARLLPLPGLHGPLELGARCLLLGALYLGSLTALGIEQEDRQVARDIVARLGRAGRRRAAAPEGAAAEEISP